MKKKREKVTELWHFVAGGSSDQLLLAWRRGRRCHVLLWANYSYLFKIPDTFN